MSFLRKLSDILTPGLKRQLGWLSIAVLMSAAAQAAALAAVLVFLSSIVDAGTSLELPLGQKVGMPTDPEQRRQFMISLGAFTAVIYSLSEAFSVLVSWLQHQFSVKTGALLAKRLLDRYLHMPYSWFMDRNSAALAKEVLTNGLHQEVLQPAVKLAIDSVVIVTLTLFVFVLSPVITLTTIVLALIVYGVLTILFRARLRQIGREAWQASSDTYKATLESLVGIKPIKVQQRELDFIRRFDTHLSRSVQAHLKKWLATQLPFHVFKFTAFMGVISLSILLLYIEKGTEMILPILGVFALISLRVLPKLASFWGSVSRISVGLPYLDAYHELMSQSFLPSGPGVLRFEGEIRFEEVSFRYPTRAEFALRKVCFSVKKGSFVGLVGPTGAGKSTVVDLILGLIRPSLGGLQVDESPIDDTNVVLWRRNVGYVPQEIFMLDDTISANITLGLPEERIDRAALERAARLAQIHEFIERELPRGYETTVGEGGLQLSGGQRQRIGIARALYNDPDVLVFDEATSALDASTEADVMESISALADVKTIVVIAHRLSTLEECDQILLFENGELSAQGEFEELKELSQTFRGMLQRLKRNDLS